MITMAGCSAGDTPTDPSSTGDESAISGEILVLTGRTDIVDTVFQEYKKTFEEKYPEVTIKFETFTDGEEVTTRMSTKDYGDVLGIQNAIPVKDYPDFFEPLGSVEELGKKYRFVKEAAFDGQVYGIAQGGAATGLVYNTEIFEAAGITEFPTTPEEFIADLQAIKDKTDAIPLYTNYKDGWPIVWPQQMLGNPSGDEDANIQMAEEDSPWAEGKDKFQVDSLLYDAVAAGLTESDPTTTNWESSKNMIATGQVAVMALGTWAVPQLREAAETAGKDPSVIGFMPAPFQVDGSFVSPLGGNIKQAINIHSEHKEAARAWIEWYVEESGYSELNVELPTRIDQPAPALLQEFEDSGVKYLEMVPSPELNEIDRQSEIGITEPDVYRSIIDSARGASGTSKEELFSSFNDKWAKARESVG